jgi:peptidoglycan-N-acetylglucosamine deacetylase
MRKRYLFAVVIIAALAIPAGGTPSKPVRNKLADDPLPIVTSETDKYWLQANEIAYRTVPELLAQHAAEYKHGIRHAKLMHGDLAARRIAITFDDGPHPNYTPKLLAILRRYKVKATFFVVGEMAEKYPYLVKAEAAAGHSVGNHTYHHVNLTKIPEDYVAAEIGACDEVLEKILGRRTPLLRPPGGDYNGKVTEVARALGYTTVLWTDDPGDYASPGENVIRRRIMDNIGNGGIILIHDGIRETIDMLPRLIQDLTNQGYQFETVEEMLRDN